MEQLKEQSDLSEKEKQLDDLLTLVTDAGKFGWVFFSTFSGNYEGNSDLKQFWINIEILIVD